MRVFVLARANTEKECISVAKLFRGPFHPCFPRSGALEQKEKWGSSKVFHGIGKDGHKILGSRFVQSDILRMEVCMMPSQSGKQARRELRGSVSNPGKTLLPLMMHRCRSIGSRLDRLYRILFTISLLSAAASNVSPYCIE
jgi:hypothetical protein